MELGNAMNVQHVAPHGAHEALVLAVAYRWSLLKRYRNSTLTARLLTLSHEEVSNALSWLSRRRNVQSMASFWSAVGGCYRWAESSDLREANYFEVVMSRLEFRWRALRYSIEHSRL